MRWVLVIAAVAVSTALHVGLAAWFLPEQTTMELAGGNQQSVVLIIGEEEFDALASGEPELQEQPLEEAIDEQKESTSQPEVTETLETTVEESSFLAPDTPPEIVEEDTPDSKISKPDSDVTALSEPVAEEQPIQQKPPISTPSPSAAQIVSKAETTEVQVDDLEQAKDGRPDVINETVSDPQETQSEPVGKLLSDEPPNAANDILVETANPQVMSAEQTQSTEQQIDAKESSASKQSENISTDSVDEVAVSTSEVPVPTPRPEATTEPTKKAKIKPTAQKKKTAKKPTAKKKQPNKKIAKKNNSQKKKSKLAKADAKSKSNTNAKRGSTATKPYKSNSQGNAKASKYPGRVYAKIARTRRKQAGDSGTARVRFVISNNGRLSSVSIARRSGSKKVDKAALDHVRRAAPFPKPPAGAKRSFVIPLQFKN